MTSARDSVRRWRRRFAAAGVMAAGTAAIVAGCAMPSGDAPPGVLRLAWGSDPASVDPALATDVVGGTVVGLLHEGLVRFARDGSVAPGIARSWTVSDDGLRWRFELDARATDSSGRNVGADEVVASFRRLLGPESRSSRAWVLESIRGARAFRAGETDEIAGLRAGDGVVQIELESPRAAFLGFLAMPNAAVLPAGLDASGHVGTGPWYLVEHVPDSHLTFRRNPHWHGTPASVQEIRVRILPDEFTRVAEFEFGNLDVLEVPENESARFGAAVPGGGTLHRQVALVTEYIGLNNEDPVLADPRVRRALNHAVNVDLILSEILSGRGVRSVGPIPPTLPGGGTGEPFDYDPDRARDLLAESNLPPDWTLELWQRPSSRVSEVLEAVQSDLAAVGVSAVIRLRDWSALKAAIDRGEPSGFFVNWYADYPDAENFLVPLFHSSNVGGGGNRARFADADVDARLAELDRVRDPEERAALAASLDRDLYDRAPWIHLWHPVLEVAVSARVAGYRPHPIFSAERWLDIRLDAVGSP